MKFNPSTLKSIDFSKLKEGSVANATLSSFSYRSGYCFGRFVADGVALEAIIGTKEECPIRDMLSLKGIEVSITFAGTKVSNGVTYPKYYVSF